MKRLLFLSIMASCSILLSSCYVIHDSHYEHFEHELTKLYNSLNELKDTTEEYRSLYLSPLMNEFDTHWENVEKIYGSENAYEIYTYLDELTVSFYDNESKIEEMLHDIEDIIYEHAPSDYDDIYNDNYPDF